MKIFHTKNFQKNLEQSPLIVIYGPTWCGKTGFSIELAQFLQNNWYFPFVISADSRQIYQEMNIGTGKITQDEMQNILHYGLDIIPPTETFSVVDFEKNINNCPFFEKWKHWEKNWKIIPIICGGTGLYIDSLIFKRNYLGSKPNPKRRQELEDFCLQYGNEALWQKLFDIDPNYAKILHPNNHTYIIRAIEIFEETGKSKLEAESPKPILKYPTIFLTPYTDSVENRQNLYNKINSRIEKMFRDGLVNEVGKIIEKYGINCPGLKTIGYKEIVSAIQWELSLEEAKNLIAQHNRNYAKRQITWNKKYNEFL